MIHHSLRVGARLVLLFFCSSMGVNADVFGGAVTNYNVDRVIQYGAPKGVYPEDIKPSLVTLDHVKPLLNQFEEYLRAGRLSEARDDLRKWYDLPAVRYLLGFVSDDEFRKYVYQNSSERLYREFGCADPDVVLLYYLTGGAVSNLVREYNGMDSLAVKRSIEICCYHENINLVGLAQEQGQVSDAPVLEINICKKPSVGVIANKNDLRKTVVAFEEKGIPSELQIEFVNLSPNEVVNLSVSVNPGRIALSSFNLKRDDGGPILWDDRCPDEKQFVSLAPGDCLVKPFLVSFQEDYDLRAWVGEYHLLREALPLGNMVISDSFPDYGESACVGFPIPSTNSITISYNQEYEVVNAQGESRNERTISNCLKLERMVADTVSVRGEHRLKKRNASWDMVNHIYNIKSTSTRVTSGPNMRDNREELLVGTFNVRAKYEQMFRDNKWLVGKSGSILTKEGGLVMSKNAPVTREFFLLNFYNKFSEEKWYFDSAGLIYNSDDTCIVDTDTVIEYLFHLNLRKKEIIAGEDFFNSDGNLISWGYVFQKDGSILDKEGTVIGDLGKEK